MSQAFSYGLKINGLKVGVIAVDGGMSTALTSPGKARENTIKVTPASPTDTEFYAEGESAAPAIIISKKGVKTIDFDLLTFDPEVIADLTGGTTTGADENIIYAEAIGVVNVERSIELTDTIGNVWAFPRVKISADLVGVFTTTDVNVVRVSCKVLTPKKVATSPFTFGKPAA